MATKAERVEAANAAHRQRCRTRLQAAGEHGQDLAHNRHIWRATAAIAGSSAVVAQYPYLHVLGGGSRVQTQVPEVKVDYGDTWCSTR